MDETTIAYVFLASAAVFFLHKLFIRLRLSGAKHPSVRGHAKWSRRLARLVAYYEFDEQHYFSSDGAPQDVASKREAGLNRLRTLERDENPNAHEFLEYLRCMISNAGVSTAHLVHFP